jgi:hypothetical protein
VAALTRTSTRGSVAYQRTVRQLLDAQRSELVRPRDAGEIPDETMHTLIRELDLEDQRLDIRNAVGLPGRGAGKRLLRSSRPPPHYRHEAQGAVGTLVRAVCVTSGVTA